MTALATGLLANPLLTFSSVLVRKSFGGGSTVFSITLVAFGIGGLIGASALLAMDPKGDHRILSSALAIVFGGLVIAGSLTPGCGPCR